MNTQLQPSGNEKDWERRPEWSYASQAQWATRRHRRSPASRQSADYALIPLNKKGEYDTDGELLIFSVNGEFKDWVRDELSGSIRGVRWHVRQLSNGNWSVGEPTDRLAIEKLMGERVDATGKQIPGTPGDVV
jgi:hypothetical protein